MQGDVAISTLFSPYLGKIKEICAYSLFVD